MPSNQNSARPLAPRADAITRGRTRAVAQDMRARGGNPVTVSDLRQRHGVGNRPGRPFLSTLLFGRG